ncbi:MAG: hypothetical protein ACR2LK_06250 [Solirubrobacteraceae bacterium]
MRKTFHAGSEHQRHEQAGAEFARLQRFSAALASVPDAQCPRPLEMLFDPPGLRMTYVAGVDLFTFLRRGRLDDAARDGLAATMAAAIDAYVGALGEPHPDFKFENVLYDAAGGGLAFVDLGLPQDATQPLPGASPYETTLGDLLGSVVFQSVQPRHVLRRGQHRRTVALGLAVMLAVARLPGAAVRDEYVSRVAAAAYRRCAFGGGASRSAWYATVGLLAGRRVRLRAQTAGPVLPRRRRPEATP